MAVAGLNLVGKIWRYTASGNDDSVGGAVPSGTVVYENVSMRIAPMRPTQALLEQGLETPLLFAAVLSPGTLVLKHNDQVEIIAPAISKFFNKRFRVMGVQESGMTSFDPRFVMITLHRVEDSVSNVRQ